MTTKKKSAAPDRSPGKSSLGSRFSPRELLQMFKERWIFGFIIGAAAAAAFVYFQPTRVPVYRSDVSLLFETRKDRVLNIQEVVDTGLGANELNIHMEQIRSKTFFEYVLASFTPEEAKRIQEPYREADQPNAPLPSLATILRPNVSVLARRNTTIIIISVTHRSPEAAQLIANRYAHRYIEYVNDSRATGTNTAIMFLRSQQDEVRNQVETAERSLQEFRAKYNVAALGENQTVVVQKNSSLGTKLVETQMQQVELSGLIEKIKQTTDQEKLLEIPQIAAHPTVSSLLGQIATLKHQRVLLEQRYLRKHPRMLENSLQMDAVMGQLKSTVQAVAADFEARFTNAKQFEARLKKELELVEAQLNEFDRIGSEYRFMQADATNKRSLYDQIVRRISDANIASQMENTNVKVFDPAVIPGSPTSGIASEIGVKAGVIGGLLLIFIPLGLGFLDTRIKSPSHVEEGLGTTLLGAVKRIKGLGEAERAHVFRLRKDDSLAETYRGIYSEMDIRSTATYPKVLLTTSSLPGDGKSLTASNLGAVYAAHGRRTLLVDCDLRRPSLHRYFGVDGRTGWIQWLNLPPEVADKALPPAVSIAENLDLLPAGGIAKNPTETLERLASSSLLKRLQDRYDLVMLDTPPVTIFPDALLLARFCNELIYICKFGTVRVNLVKRTLERLQETGVTVLGVVLNDMPEARLRSGYQGYGAYSTDYYRAYAKT